MLIPLSEAVDMLSICLVRLFNTIRLFNTDPMDYSRVFQLLERIRRLDSYIAGSTLGALFRSSETPSTAQQTFYSLHAVNSQLWQLEDELRKYHSLEEIDASQDPIAASNCQSNLAAAGKVAIKIQKANIERSRLKATIAELVKDTVITKTYQ